MGGAGATSELISQGGLARHMLESLNGLYGPPVKPTGDNHKDTEILRERLLEYNKTCFFDEFSYTYCGNESRPENYEEGDKIVGKDGFASFPIEQLNNVRYYIEHRILGGTSLSKDDKNQFKSDVLDMVQSLVLSDSHGWQSEEFVRAYGDLRFDGMIIWDVINAPDPSGRNPTSQRIMVLNYVGVGYPRR